MTSGNLKKYSVVDPIAEIKGNMSLLSDRIRKLKLENW